MGRQFPRWSLRSFVPFTLLAVSAVADTCTFTDPVSADGNFDWNLDQSIGTADLTVDATRKSYYASKYKAVKEEGRVVPQRRWLGHLFSNRALMARDSSLFDLLNAPFTSAKTTITAVVNQAFTNNQAQLDYGYTDVGPSPPCSDLIQCPGGTDPWTWCDASTSTPHPAPALLPGMDDTTDADAPSSNATYATLTSVGGTVVLHQHPNGNIYPFSEDAFDHGALGLASTRQFSGIGSFITGCAKGRLLHAYKDTLASNGVSRFRHSHVQSVPTTAVPVTLVPGRNPSGGPAIIVAVDTSSNPYYVVTCSYPDTYSKLFLAKDCTAGVAKLQDPAMQSTVTGRPVTSCSCVPYTSGAGPL